jgi:hypothetical protein
LADSAAFELACEMLERETSLDRLAARGTIRLALKAAGLEAHNVAPDQMTIVVANLLPQELESRGAKDGARVCAAIGEKLARLETENAAETPETVFARLGS